MASAMTIPKGLNMATYTGPFFRHAHTYTTFRVDITTMPYKSHKINYNHKIRSQVPIVQKYWSQLTRLQVPIVQNYILTE